MTYQRAALEGSQRGPNRVGPRAVGKDQTKVGDDKRRETQGGRVRGIEQAP